MACAKGGAGAYTDAIQAEKHDPTGVAGLSRGVVAASSFRTAYVPLSTQADFIGGLQVRNRWKSSRVDACRVAGLSISVDLHDATDHPTGRAPQFRLIMGFNPPS